MSCSKAFLKYMYLFINLRSKSILFVFYEINAFFLEMETYIFLRESKTIVCILFE